jgi:putative ATPase
MDLFEQSHRERMAKDAPLAARMRPRTLEEFVGQEHIIGPGRLLRRSIQADQLGSLIFYGPPGTGKTTLAQVIANTTRAHFIALNAVLSGVKEIREAVAEAQLRARQYSQRTILFVDEVHRFNKAQQDALLPWVENGTVIFIGATTENPYFEVNKALVSRSRIFQMLPLNKDHLRQLLFATLQDAERGYGRLGVTIDNDAVDHLVEVANGDARAVLNALELAVETTAPQGDVGGVHITLAIAEESIQRRAVLYDKEGDYHFDTISAFIKSLRGSDTDAAMYWMAKMVYAGESPRFIFRRMLIFAGEDVGMADPQAIQVVNACAQAFEQVGLPEGRFHLALAALYLSTARKSNSAFAFFDALTQVGNEGDSGVPSHLRDASRDSEGFGHGEGYLYPHAYRDHWVAQQYLPASLQGKVFYEPSDQGYEAAIRDEVARRREANLSAMLESEDDIGPLEILTSSPDDPAHQRWMQRLISNSGGRLGLLRDRVLDGARLVRHSVVLDLRAGAGLLTWEALRRVPEGGVVALARTPRDADALREMAERLPEAGRPMVMQGGLDELPMLLQLRANASQQASPTRFDAIVGFNALLNEADKREASRLVAGMLEEAGVLSLAERIPRHTQRIYRLVDAGELGDELAQRWREAEEAIYTTGDAMVGWDADDLVSALRETGLEVEFTVDDESAEMQVTPAVLERWFGIGKEGKPSYGEHLRQGLSAAEVDQVRALLERRLVGEVVRWGSRTVCVVAKRSGGLPRQA